MTRSSGWIAAQRPASAGPPMRRRWTVAHGVDAAPWWAGARVFVMRRADDNRRFVVMNAFRVWAACPTLRLPYHQHNRPECNRSRVGVARNGYLAGFPSPNLSPEGRGGCHSVYRTKRLACQSGAPSRTVAVVSQWIDQFGSPEHHAMLSGWPLPCPRRWLR